jgi:hypothetical protein
MTMTIALVPPSVVNLPLATAATPPEAATPPSGKARATTTTMSRHVAAPGPRRRLGHRATVLVPKRTSSRHAPVKEEEDSD